MSNRLVRYEIRRLHYLHHDENGFLDTMGDDGWELVAVLREGDQRVYYFKMYVGE